MRQINKKTCHIVSIHYFLYIHVILISVKVICCGNQKSMIIAMHCLNPWGHWGLGAQQINRFDTGHSQKFCFKYIVQNSWFWTLSMIKVILVQVTHKLFYSHFEWERLWGEYILSAQVFSTARINIACQIDKQECKKKSTVRKREKRRSNEEDVEAAEMTHIGATHYEFAMMLLGLLAHGWGARGDGRCTVGYLSYPLCNSITLVYSSWQTAHQRYFSFWEKARVKGGRLLSISQGDREGILSKVNKQGKSWEKRLKDTDKAWLTIKVAYWCMIIWPNKAKTLWD